MNTASLTGEPLPARVTVGARLLSGSLNGESPLTIEATAPARESQYARIVELVRTAQASKAPLQRLADRYAVWFTPLTLLVCAVAFLITRDPVRVLAVLVVATPCPLILATPVAIIGGVNRAARQAIVFRTGTALERLGGVDTAVFDKTGTLTLGRPVVAGVSVAPGLERRALLAADKVAVVHGLLEHGHRVLMVGDGTNDAPALGAATVGAALAAGGSGISAEAADVVLLAEDLRLLARAIEITRRTLHIARQSIWAGLGGSAIAMAFAAAGLIPPTAGAVLQEVIDVAVILDAPRAGR